jgi:hypothetical protein
MKYLDLHLKENLIRQTSFLRKTPPKSPRLLGLSNGISKRLIYKILYFVGQLRQTVSNHKCKKIVETRCFDGNFGRGKEVEKCVGFFKRWINLRRYL